MTPLGLRLIKSQISWSDAEYKNERGKNSFLLLIVMQTFDEYFEENQKLISIFEKSCKVEKLNQLLETLTPSEKGDDDA